MKLFPKEYLWQEIYELICDAYKMAPSRLEKLRDLAFP
ncbi:hypothetical protein LEP1GSC163_2040 [Leptospira santarosai str. CBC379]|uniref:Uncharacterized protein n=1 Tax=Leptospira santarosai str. MOR084 TaxID=1049984 RepID=A0A0E2BJC8_9LEPT|nr:hypothetical protein LEP1GSC179_1129 [Leptospira santarosai str. MOR084]EKR92884.1 hypothetical protein LEP1GSC163_2040 [Leptospira santarosai str. CBC379]